MSPRSTCRAAARAGGLRRAGYWPTYAVWLSLCSWPRTSCATRWCSASSTRMSANRTKPERAAVKLELTVQKAVNSPGLPTNAELRRWLAAALEQSAAVTVRFVGAGEGRRLNRAYRDRDYATNVLSFGYGSPG